MNQNLKYGLLIVLFAFIAGGIIGFFIGRATINTKEETKYVKGEKQAGSISPEEMEPTKVTTPEKPQLPQDIFSKTSKPEVITKDSIVYKDRYIEREVDSMAIFRAVYDDYIKQRDYNLLTFKRDDLGTLKINQSIQYNRMQKFDWDFEPVYKETSKYNIKIWQPFVSASYSTLDYMGIGGGLFYHDLGFEYQYNFDLRRKPNLTMPVDNYFQRGNYHWFSGKYKF